MPGTCRRGASFHDPAPLSVQSFSGGAITIVGQQAQRCSRLGPCIAANTLSASLSEPADCAAGTWVRPGTDPRRRSPVRPHACYSGRVTDDATPVAVRRRKGNGAGAAGCPPLPRHHRSPDAALTQPAQRSSATAIETHAPASLRTSTSHFRLPGPLQQTGSGSRKHINVRDRDPIKQDRAHA